MKDYILTYLLPSGFQRSFRRMIPNDLEGQLLANVGKTFKSGCKLLAAEEISLSEPSEYERSQWAERNERSKYELSQSINQHFNN